MDRKNEPQIQTHLSTHFALRATFTIVLDVGKVMKRRILILLGVTLLVGGFSGLINARLLKNEIREDFLSLYPEPQLTTLGMTGNPTEADRKKSSDEHERFNRHQTMLKSIAGSDSKFEWVFRHSAILGGILAIASAFSFKSDSNQSTQTTR